MSTVEEIRSAINKLAERDRALLKAQLFAFETEPNAAELEAALQRGLADVAAGRLHEIDDVKKMIPGWTSKS